MWNYSCVDQSSVDGIQQAFNKHEVTCRSDDIIIALSCSDVSRSYWPSWVLLDPLGVGCSAWTSHQMLQMAAVL